MSSPSRNPGSHQSPCPHAEAKGAPRAGATLLIAVALLAALASARSAGAATPCDGATVPSQCGWFTSGDLPPYVKDAIFSKGGALGAGNVLVLTSGSPGDSDTEISNDMSQAGCGTNPDGWETFDCNLLDNFVPPEDSVVLALSSEWFEWYQSIFTDWMTISGGGVPTVDVSINSWINSKVDTLPYGPNDTGVVILTSLASSKMVNFRVADSGDHIYDTAIVVVPASWMGAVSGSSQDETLLCGDGKLEPGEECDDGNTNTDDGCSSICLGTQPPTTPVPATTCGNLVYAWPNGATAPYTCGSDACGGYRCVLGTTISPACYTADQCATACAGTCVDIQTAKLDCSSMCSVQPPANEPTPVVPETCNALVYSWPDGTTMPYTCDDACAGQRCVVGTTISPACYGPGECDPACTGTCVDVSSITCAAICDLADQVVAEQADPACDPAVDTEPRLAANQTGPCLGNMEVCSSTTSTWKIEGWEPEDEKCNGVDDDCNGAADDMFETCGDPGLCQHTVNRCDPNNPTVPVACDPLPPPSPVEICNDGLDNDCDGDADDGCECGDDECMPGETFLTCPGECPPPANGTPCDDGDFCTLGDAYQGGTCVSGSVLNTCDDDNACTTNESCDPSSGCSATKVDCDDNDPCTIDGCDTAAGCTHAVDPACAGVDADGDGFTSVASGGTDCDDSDAFVHPGANELCNGADDDCDAQTDEDFGVGTACESAANACGTTATGVLVCAGDGFVATCDAVTPPNPPTYGDACTSAANACGETAQGTVDCSGNCNAVTPPNPPTYGDACTSAPNVCGATAEGTLDCSGNCSATAPPAADNDGDGTPDCLDQCPGDPNKTQPGTCGCGAPETGNATFFRDADGDGFGNAAVAIQACTPPSGYVADQSDCDDSRAAVHPGAAEVCNEIDDDCDGQVDDGIDADHDGVGDCGADLCLGTKADRQYVPRVPLLILGPNRWELRAEDGGFVWATTHQKKPNASKPTIADTHGCSCKQILDRMRAEQHGRGVDLVVQYLLGCSKKTLSDWADR